MFTYRRENVGGLIQGDTFLTFIRQYLFLLAIYRI